MNYSFSPQPCNRITQSGGVGWGENPVTKPAGTGHIKMRLGAPDSPVM